MFQFKECREMRGYSQKYVAVSLGVKPPSVSDWEKGKTNPTLDNLVSLAQLLHVSTDMLLGVQSEALDKSNTYDAFNQTENHSQSIMAMIDELNEEGKEKVIEYVNDLIATGRYIKMHPSVMDKEA